LAAVTEGTLMTNTNKLLTLGVAAALFVAGGQAFAAQDPTVTWDMSGGVSGEVVVGTTHPFTADSITISAAGFADTALSVPTALELKNDGGNEIGLGIAAGGADHELTGNERIVVNFTNAVGAGATDLSFDFRMGSATGPDRWDVMGSNSATGPFAEVMHGQGNGVHSGLPLFNFYEFSATGGDVLLHEVSANVSPVSTPEPASLALFGLGLFGLGLAGRRKRS